MAAGRPRKPRHIKEQQGTIAPSREVSNPLMADRLSKIPDCPARFNENEKRFYNYTCQILLELKLLTPQFIMDIINASTWYHLAVDAADKLREGNIIKESKAYTQPHAYLKVFSDATKHLNEFNNHYGFNLTASQKIEMPTIEDSDDDLLK